jgi:Flp pilus assembly protein TadG
MTSFSNRALRRLRKDQRGAALMEFALVAPTFILLVMGGLEAGHSLYVRAVLQGAVQKAARDAALEGAVVGSVQTSIDTKVRDQIFNTYNVQPTFSRRYYRSFEKAASAQAEPFTDTPASAMVAGQPNGVCDRGEAYTDNNSNSTWDRDGADAGLGGPEDKVVYTATMSYPTLFGMAGLLGFSNTQTVSATTVIGNQPYGDQKTYGTPVNRNCPV